MTARASLDLACDLLRCPMCAKALERADGALRCPARHTFDVARQGYVSLLSGNKAISGDDADMARARERFLASGAYAPLRDEVVRAAVRDRAPRADHASDGPVVLDMGAGTGYYLAGVLDALPSARGLALDTSVRSLRVAARAHPRAVAATWDAFKPFPMADASVDVLLDVFAPRNPVEFARVLAPHGRLVVARPAQNHLAELRAEHSAMVAIDPAKEERLSRALAPHLRELSTEHVQARLDLDARQARDLVGMTPSARHLDLDALPADGEDITVTLSVLVGTYAPLAGAA